MKMRHGLKAIGISLISLVIMAGAYSPACAAEKPYKIGCNFEMTGPFSNFVAFIKNALILEEERVNAKGGIDGHPLELIFEDSAMDLTKAANISRKFARNKEIKAIIGPMFSPVAPTLIPVIEREKVPELAIWAPSSVERRLKPHWIFSIPQGDIVLAERLIDLAMGRGYKKIFAFSEQAPNWLDAQEKMKEIGKKHGIEVFISKETYFATDTDMTPQILKFREQLKNFDVIWLGTNGVTGATVVRNLLTQGIRMPVMGTHAWGFESTLAIGKEAVEGAEFVAGKAIVADQLDNSDPQTPVIVDFDKRMKARWGMPADQLSGHGYDAIWILYHAFKRAGENPTRGQLRDAIEKTRDFIGATGVFNYSPTDHLGLTKKSLTFIKIENNKFVRIKLPGID
jgi:branched-chain amino acid transport system substrate-binding protein